MDGQPRTGSALGIIVAAGRSERMGGIDKMFATAMGRPLIAWALLAYRRCRDIDGVVVVAAPESVDRVRALVREWRMTNVRDVVPGGATRQQSVRAGLTAAADAQIVSVHDAARPLVTPDLIATGVAIARAEGAAICATPSRDTVKQVDPSELRVLSTPGREGAWLAQTPQTFDRALLLRAHEQASGDTATDDAQLVEALGHVVRVHRGDAWNMKVTEPDDLLIAEALLRRRYADV